jgi:hypothetical protein
LSKAGEKQENPYLFDPNRPTRVPRKKMADIFGIRSRKTSYGPTYIYQCSSCGRKFYKKTQDSVIKPHKSKTGFLCYGYGVYAGVKY